MSRYEPRPFAAHPLESSHSHCSATLVNCYRAPLHSVVLSEPAAMALPHRALFHSASVGSFRDNNASFQMFSEEHNV